LGEAREDRRGEIKELPERLEPYAGFAISSPLSVHHWNLKNKGLHFFEHLLSIINSASQDHNRVNLNHSHRGDLGQGYKKAEYERLSMNY